MEDNDLDVCRVFRQGEAGRGIAGWRLYIIINE